MIPLRFLQCWNGFDRGAEVSFPHPGLAEDLVRQRVAEVIGLAAVGPKPKAKTAAGPKPGPAPKK